MVNPYEQINKKDYFIRTFNSNINKNELVWHRDAKNRIVVPVEGKNWKFQFDNTLPKNIVKYNEIVIPKNIYHRILIGNDTLKIYIYETNNIEDVKYIEKIKNYLIDEYNKII